MEQYLTFFSNHPILSIAWLAIFLMIIFTTIKIKMSPVKVIGTQELSFLVNKENAVLVDIRDENDFKARHIIDSRRLAKEKIAKNDFASLENDKDKPIIIICNAGISAQGVAEKLIKADFNKVNVLKGGINGWISAGLPVIKK